MKDIYKLKLHEMCKVKDLTVMRVPGGWLYFTPTEDAIAFVPFNAEFQAVEKERE